MPIKGRLPRRLRRRNFENSLPEFEARRYERSRSGRLACVDGCCDVNGVFRDMLFECRLVVVKESSG